MQAKAIPVGDDHRRELVQKTLLASLNRAKETIERVETAGMAMGWTTLWATSMTWRWRSRRMTGTPRGDALSRRGRRACSGWEDSVGRPGGKT
jgi:hypothetical protein